IIALMPSIPFFKKHKKQKSGHCIQKNFPVRFHIHLLHYKDKSPLEQCIKIYMNMRENIAGKFMSPTTKYKSTSVASHTFNSVYFAAIRSQNVFSFPLCATSTLV